jgi:hypothetical protein
MRIGSRLAIKSIAEEVQGTPEQICKVLGKK